MLDQIVLAFGDLPLPVFGEDRAASGTRESRGRLRVLIVDDERLIADTLTAILNEHDFDAMGAYGAVEAMEIVRRAKPDAVLSDVLMPKMSGIELGINIRKEFPAISIFLFSGQSATTELLRKAQAEGYRFELLPKPIHPEDLMARLREI